jgi:hypothetical protein
MASPAEVTNTPIHPFKCWDCEVPCKVTNVCRGSSSVTTRDITRGAVLAFDWRSSKLGTGFGVPPTAIDSPSPSENPLPSSRKHHITGIGDEAFPVAILSLVLETMHSHRDSDVNHVAEMQ